MSAYSKAEIKEMSCWACGSDARIELHHLRPQRADGRWALRQACREIIEESSK